MGDLFIGCRGEEGDSEVMDGLGVNKGVDRTLKNELNNAIVAEEKTCSHHRQKRNSHCFSVFLNIKFVLHTIDTAMGAPALAFSVPDATSEQLLRLVASYSGCPTPIDIKIVHGSRTVEFSTAHGENIQGLTTACICIVSASPVATQLLGSTPEQEAKVCTDGAMYTQSLNTHVCKIFNSSKKPITSIILSFR